VPASRNQIATYFILQPVAVNNKYLILDEPHLELAFKGSMDAKDKFFVVYKHALG